MGAISGLSHTAVGRPALVTAGAVEQLVRLCTHQQERMAQAVGDGHTFPAAAGAARAAAEASGGAGGAATAPSGPAPSLQQLQEAEQMPTHASDAARALEHAAICLRNLARHAPSRARIVSAWAVRPLLQVPLLLLDYHFTYLP